MNTSTFAKLQRQEELFTELLAGRNASELSDKELVRIGQRAELLSLSEKRTPAQEQILMGKWLIACAQSGLVFEFC